MNQKVKLQQTLKKRFNESELRLLCFELGIDYEDLPGQTKTDRTRELVEYFDRRDRLSELEAAIEKARSDSDGGSSSMPLIKNPRVIAALIGAAAVIIAALIAVWTTSNGNSSSTSTATPPNTAFVYQVQVRDKITGEAIDRANVMITVGGIAPLNDVTDAEGLAIISLDSSHAGKVGRLIVEAPGYQTYELHINLTEDSLPTIIQLEPKP